MTMQVMQMIEKTYLATWLWWVQELFHDLQKSNPFFKLILCYFFFIACWEHFYELVATHSYFYAYNGWVLALV